MAFTLSPDIATDKISFQASVIGSDHVVQVLIGQDDGQGGVYSLMVAMSPPGGAVKGEFELVFCIVEIDAESGEERARIWDGLEARRILTSPELRQRTLNALRVSVRYLIMNLSPTLVTMQSWTPSLPPKAIRKFNLISTLFGQNGYRSGQADPYHGQRIWIMEKL